MSLARALSLLSLASIAAAAQQPLHLESRTGVVLLRNYDAGRTRLARLDGAARALLAALMAAAKENGASPR